MTDQPGVRCIVVAADGRVLDVMEDVSLGDRVQAIEDGRESLHTAALWAYLAVKADEAGREAGR